MNIKMLLSGVAGGAIGLIVWVAAGLAGYEIGWIAWGIGALVGLGTRFFNEKDTPLAALSGALTAAAMVLLGKYIVYVVAVEEGFSFIDTFGLLDLLWFVLACGTAARLSFVGEGDD